MNGVRRTVYDSQMIGRRAFLRLFGVAAAGFVLDPDLALWVPGRKTIIDLHTAPVLATEAEYGGAYFVGGFDAILKTYYEPFIREQLSQPNVVLALTPDGGLLALERTRRLRS